MNRQQMKSFNFVIAIILLTACPHMARAEVSFAYVSAGQAAQMVSGTDAPMLAQGSQFSMSLRKRVVSGHVEKHMDWNEELVIQEGDVLLNYGDTIAGGKSVMLHAGDIVILPAGLWHQQVLKAPLMRYVLFKTRK